MNAFIRAFFHECTKLKRATVPKVSFLVITLIALALGGFVWIMMHPGMAASLGLLGQKAMLALGNMSPGWPAYATLLTEVAGLGGLLFASMLLSWLVAVEYQQGTAKIMLVLPMARYKFLLSKIILGAIWLYLLFAWFLGISFLLGLGAGLPAIPEGLPGALLGRFSLILLADLGVSMPVLLIALASRGIFAPLAYAVGSLLLASMFSSTGWGPYIPWAVIAIISGAGGAGLEANLVSWIIVGSWAVLFLVLAITQIEAGDNHQ